MKSDNYYIILCKPTSGKVFVDSVRTNKDKALKRINKIIKSTPLIDDCWIIIPTPVDGETNLNYGNHSNLMNDEEQIIKYNQIDNLGN